ncbi:hypothetical protein [Tropicibacter oceani]|uniref:Uncharacterized protein n=1 Tax=Tropicibacter oceani TaxID=3058420 RepID=A0ABY8QKL3_9RHOB|nr:hypothetical protein [Tropicibacter oceani]WGW04518.1 hypothetical protein QF118_02915 [Tropicibacter oceani]
MSLYLNTQHIVWDEFGGLEKPKEEWRDQFAYWEDYVEKFFQSNGMAFDPSDCNVEPWLMSDDRAPFAGMVENLLPRLAERTGLDDTDAILFAHWLPDLHLGTSVTNFAMHQLGLRNCFGFAISDRGLSAPFFAFDSLYKYLLNGRRRGLLIVADQKHVMYKSDLVHRLNPKNAACVVHVDTENETGLRYAGYRRHVLAQGESAGAAVATILDGLGLDAARTCLVGPADLLDAAALGADRIVTQDRLVCSAPFAALSQAQDMTRNYLLLCRDGQAVSALGFEGESA